ncbi:glycoprotein-N-acetylgalactosamine 3-beta-galactosyltransferase 1-like [Neocloeon triangulifer]|uniref:glycoprotein-N-acetylgalactosamine 3-beta-galactosyltransferase 1-like n=1 Tax=Neocloeon triangulifer TaxID=2078957 RepID=UPI00286F1070|nr:glycoprotein-N-acetylgalactosamine 3-beta-galactosyltransferase 1-like [Neocloeon triangulifer]
MKRSQGLNRAVRVLCWVCTTGANHASKAAHVKATWGRRCDKLIFFSDEEDEDLPAVGIAAPKGRAGLWRKTVQAFIQVHDQFANEFDWFLKADDDTYVIVENLRRLLVLYDPNAAKYLGMQFKKRDLPKGYATGGAGYVLSRGALKKLVTAAFPAPNPHCQLSNLTSDEDVLLGLIDFLQ